MMITHLAPPRIHAPAEVAPKRIPMKRYTTVHCRSSRSRTDGTYRREGAVQAVGARDLKQFHGGVDSGGGSRDGRGEGDECKV